MRRQTLWLIGFVLALPVLCRGQQIILQGNIACQGNIVLGAPNSAGSSSPYIQGLSAIAGAVGSSLTIYGANFGASPGTVTLNGTSTMTVVSGTWTNSSVQVTVPSGGTSGNIVLTAGNFSSNAVGFTVTAALQPTITGLSTNGGPVGTPVTIFGTNLGSAGTVSFNTTTATTTSWGPTQIVAQVPNAPAGVVQITVAVGGVTSNPAAFTVTVGPYIDHLSLTSGPPTMGFVISGAGFGGAPGQATLNGATMTVVAGTWSDTSITVQVPGNAGNGGPVVVTNGTQSQRNPQFNVTGPFGCQ